MSKEPNTGWTEALGEHASNPAQPRTSGDTVHALGQTWRVASCENRLKAQFEQWVRANTKKQIAEVERTSPEEANEFRSTYLRDLGAGHYNWDGRAIRQALRDIPGLTYLFFLLLRRCHPRITEAKAQEIMVAAAQDCGLAIAWALGNSKTPTRTATNGVVVPEDPDVESAQPTATLDGD
jgi:hypothetical protein